jgi:sigma54-dependent transcription regulator
VGLRATIERLLRSTIQGSRPPSVSLQGETGTGKDLVASTIHRMSRCRDARFVDVNCTAIPGPLLEAELFGYERGAFTDARSKPGLFEVAHGGTLLLDEVGLLPSAMQAKLLTVLEERSVRRLGGTQQEAADVWVVTPTSLRKFALTPSAVFLAALLDEVARYCRATSQELNAMTEGRATPRETLLRLSGLGQHYLSCLATLPTRFGSSLAVPRRGPRSRRRRQGRIID